MVKVSVWGQVVHLHHLQNFQWNQKHHVLKGLKNDYY